MGGYFKVYRDIFQHEIFKHELDFRLFMLILGNAAYQDTTIEGVPVKRGQWIRSYRMLMKDLEYKEKRGYKQYGIATIKRAIQRLIKIGLVTVSETDIGTLFTVVNYEKYQGSWEPADQKTEHLSERNRNEIGTSSEQKKEIKKLNNDDNDNPVDPSDFDLLPDLFEEHLTEEQQLEKEIADYYETKRGRSMNQSDWPWIRKAIEEGFTRDEMIQGINLAFLQAKKIYSFEYCLKVMRTERERAQKAKEKKVVPINRKPTKPDESQLPQVLRPDYQPPQKTISPERLQELKEKAKRMGEVSRRFQS